ncbi:MAG: arsenate reductase [Betaproteobacteria bacterium]|nr:arsenate reductase [Betaproteobacteria bacterium]
MKITVYGIKNCDTMKKAFAWLSKNGIDSHFHDYKKSGVPIDRLRAWSEHAGWQKIVNTRGTTWRKIPESERENLNEARALALLEKYPSAIKRPVVEAGAKLLVGFDDAEFARTFK